MGIFLTKFSPKIRQVFRNFKMKWLPHSHMVSSTNSRVFWQVITVSSQLYNLTLFIWTIMMIFYIFCFKRWSWLWLFIINKQIFCNNWEWSSLVDHLYQILPRRIDAFAITGQKNRKTEKKKPQLKVKYHMSKGFLFKHIFQSTQ